MIRIRGEPFPHPRIRRQPRLPANAWARTTIACREQWIFAALLGITWCGDVVLATVPGGHSWGLLPGATLMAILALRARWWPLSSGVSAAVVMASSTVAARLLGLSPGPGLIANVLPTENAAGLLLVLYLFWKAPRSRAIPVTAFLVLVCVTAVFVRDGEPFTPQPGDIPRTLLGGLLQLVLVVGTGMYLRGREPRTPETPLQALLRRQWPVIAALCVLLFGQLLATDLERFFPGGLLVLLGCVVMAGLAVLAPLRPVETALLGALTVFVMTGLSLALGVVRGTPLLGATPVPVVAGGMLLAAFVTRHAAARHAGWSVAALVGAGLSAAFLMPRPGPLTWPADVLGPAFMGGVLLLVSIGTGMYFRARDEDRARTVAVAVTNAQHAERMALARELHDVVAHHVTGIVVQAQAARAVSGKNPDAAFAAMDRIAETGTEALTAMRRLVGSMRDTDGVVQPDPIDHPTTDLEADLHAMVARIELGVAGGKQAPRLELAVHLVSHVPPEVARSTLRLVQESLTNVHKHAFNATRVRISVVSGKDGLSLVVIDDGCAVAAQPAGGSGGYGLVGMRERVALLGGSFASGPRHPDRHVGRGWMVRARLPLEPRENGGGRDDPGTDR